WQTAADAAKDVVQTTSGGPESLTFTIPASLAAGVFAFRVEDDDGTRIYGRVNVPEIYWSMGLPAPSDLTRPDAQVLQSAVAQGGFFASLAARLDRNPLSCYAARVGSSPFFR